MIPFSTNCWEVHPRQPLLVSSPQALAALRIQSISLYDYNPGRSVVGVRLCGAPENQSGSASDGWANLTHLEVGKTESVSINVEICHAEGPIAFAVDGPNPIHIIGTWITLQDGMTSILEQNLLPVSQLAPIQLRTQSQSASPHIHQDQTHLSEVRSVGTRRIVDGVKCIVSKTGDLRGGTPRDGQWVHVTMTTYYSKQKMVDKQNLVFKLTRDWTSEEAHISSIVSTMHKGEALIVKSPGPRVCRYQAQTGLTTGSSINMIICLHEFGDNRIDIGLRRRRQRQAFQVRKSIKKQRRPQFH
ncbi:hypothetical protein SISNIDRAFT_469434 [Sistotremastrum niveocremeum HHB9708]|uniref:Uncharacterized protein n=1 Tax=Sistotremastrum niveocremeum HHB9708 TaxID=1314777 RepID=A0A164Q809_9AGAM|nr:hypothetical protein SISNIDRAFT_469434 [Sistotremastrum niveocremeum HHB9708]